MKTKTRTKRSREVAAPVYRALFDIHRYIETLPPDDQDALVRDIAALSETNGAWYASANKQALTEIANYAISESISDRRRAAARLGALSGPGGAA